MYEQRVKVFIGVSLAVLLVCMLRLVQLQLLTSPELQDEIAKATQRRGTSKQFTTLRGKILDRRGTILAADMPQFRICVNYSLSCFLDERVVQAKLAMARTRSANPSQYEIRRQVDDKQQDLERIIDKCSRLGGTREQIEGKIKALNNAFWNARSFL
jgi:cell division protein FtsI/penicillin-binding protein 2